MIKLLQVLLRNGGLLTFVVVEIICFFIVVQFNERQGAIFSYSTGLWGGNLLQQRRKVADYFSLQEQVDSLAAENARLQEILANRRMMQVPYRDTFYSVLYDSISHIDSIRRRATRPEFHFIAAKVVGNTVNNTNNWLILNRGSDDGVKADFGVVSAQGVGGIVRHVTPNFSIVMSPLHPESRISAKVKKYGAFGSLIWEGGDPERMTLKFIPRHFNISVGDTILTSGLSSMFPNDHPVGTVVEAGEVDPENPYFWRLLIKPSQDMTTISHVYIVDNLFKTEIDSLILKTPGNE
jgi:rod shape-determining protein MreC